MGLINGLYHYQAKFKGKIAVSNLAQEGFTTTWYADVFDVDTGDTRTLDTSGPYLIVIDPQNKKKKGIEVVIPASIAQSAARVTFTNTLRGVSLDDLDDAGDYDNAKTWTVGTEIGIVTDYQNNNLLKELIAGSRQFENSMEFGASQNFRNTLTFNYTPAYLTCGSSPTTTAATWAAVTD